MDKHNSIFKYQVWTVVEKVDVNSKKGRIFRENIGETVLTGEFDTYEDANKYQLHATVDCVYNYMKKGGMHKGENNGN